MNDFFYTKFAGLEEVVNKIKVSKAWLAQFDEPEDELPHNVPIKPRELLKPFVDIERNAACEGQDALSETDSVMVELQASVPCNTSLDDQAWEGNHTLTV